MRHIRAGLALSIEFILIVPLALLLMLMMLVMPIPRLHHSLLWWMSFVLAMSLFGPMVLFIWLSTWVRGGSPVPDLLVANDNR